MGKEKSISIEFNPKDCQILFYDNHKVPMHINYIHSDEGPRISMFYWGNKEYREFLCLLTTQDYKGSELNKFYGKLLEAQEAKKLNLDSLVEITKKMLKSRD